MAQHDKIKREINMTGLVLGKLLHKLKLSGDHQRDQANDVSVDLLSELNIDVTHFLDQDNKDSIKYLVNDKKFVLDDIREFGHLLYEMAGYSKNKANKRKLYTKVLELYEYVNTNGNGTLFLDVEYRIKELKQYTA